VSTLIFRLSTTARYCPMGRKLAYVREVEQQRRRESVRYRQYECISCQGCPLASECKAGKGVRSVSRDEHEEIRQAMTAKMASVQGRETYGRRKWICETLFGVVKGAWGLRRFLPRGLEKVRTEWLWACTALNLRKLAMEVGRMRVRFAALAG